MEVVVCQYFQSGFCKFQDFCRKQHIKDLCETNKCTSKVCVKRHPKECKYFKTQNGCKFNELCAYQHNITTDTSTIEDLVIQINTLANTVMAMSEKIDVLENILQNKCHEGNSSSTQSLQCDQCEYKASTTTVLKRHITSKHKKNIVTPEKERSRDLNTSLNVLPIHDKRSEEIFPPAMKQYIPEPIPDFKQPEPLNYMSSPAMQHSPGSSYDNSKIPHTCHICKTVFNNRENWMNHMTEEHNF